MMLDERVSPVSVAVRGLMLIAAAAIALFNGSLLSPIFDSVSYILYLTTRNFPLMTAARASNATQVVIAVMTLMWPAFLRLSTNASGTAHEQRRFRSASGWWRRCC